MPLPAAAEFRNRSKKHSEVRELLAQLVENVYGKEQGQLLSNQISSLSEYVKNQVVSANEETLRSILDDLIAGIAAEHSTLNGWNANLIVTSDGRNQQTVNNDFSAFMKQSIKPLFVESFLSFKAGIGAPSGVSNYANGNYVLNVSGNKNDSFVIVNSGNIEHAGGSWAAVIEYSDGTFGCYQVLSKSGSQLNIYPSLARDVTNVRLGNIHDMAQGQHYTALGYKAFAQHIYNFDAKYALREKYIAVFNGVDTVGDWIAIGNPTLTYNRGLSPSSIANNLIIGDSNKSFTVKANAAEEGVSWEISLDKIEGYLELNIGIYEGSIASIEFYLDDVLTETKTVQLFAERLIFEYSNYSKAKLVIKMSSGTTVRIGRTVWWSGVGKSNRLFSEYARKIAYLGDSWGTYSNAANPNEILRLHKVVNPSAELLNFSKGGMTTKYAVKWIDHILAQKPDVVIIEYFTNDSNCINGASAGINFLDPAGNTHNTFVTKEDFFRNLAILANKCIKSGVQPIFIMPAVVESQTQTQYHAILAREIGTGGSSVPRKLSLENIKAVQSITDHLYVDKIETKTLYNTALEIITSVFGVIVKPRVMRYGDNALFQVQNFNGSKLLEVIADELIGNKMPSLNLTGADQAQGLKLVKSQIVDSTLSSYGGNVLRIRGKQNKDLKAIQIGENSGFVEFKAPSRPYTVTTLPAPDGNLRGLVYLVQEGDGVADKLYICLKNASNGYSWKEL